MAEVAQKVVDGDLTQAGVQLTEIIDYGDCNAYTIPSTVSFPGF